MKFLLIVAPLVVGLVAALGFVILVGSFLPRDHVATRSARYAAAPQAVWDIVSDFPSHPSWRGVKSMEQLPDRDGHAVWKEVGSWGDAMTVEVQTLDPPRRMVTRIADDSLPFGGTWTYELTPDGGGTRVRVTEDGFVKPAAFRYISRLTGHTGTMEKYLRALGRKLGEDVTPGA